VESESFLTRSLFFPLLFPPQVGPPPPLHDVKAKVLLLNNDE